MQSVYVLVVLLLLGTTLYSNAIKLVAVCLQARGGNVLLRQSHKVGQKLGAIDSLYKEKLK